MIKNQVRFEVLTEFCAPNLFELFLLKLKLNFPADVVFLLGREEERIYAHRLILMSRCKSFQVAPGISGEFFSSRCFPKSSLLIDFFITF